MRVLHAEEAYAQGKLRCQGLERRAQRTIPDDLQMCHWVFSLDQSHCTKHILAAFRFHQPANKKDQLGIALDGSRSETFAVHARVVNVELLLRKAGSKGRIADRTRDADKRRSSREEPFSARQVVPA